MNCKPGDLAVIVAPYIEAGRGRVVQVLHLATQGDFCRLGYHDKGRLAWFCKGDIVNERHGQRIDGIVADCCLRPITPPPGTVTTDEVRELYSPKQTEAA